MAERRKPEAEKFDAERERQLFYAMLSDPANHATYRSVLGPNVSLDKFLASARDAVEAQPILLTPSWRSSLMFSIKKAAQQGLRPDGKQGALVPRWNSDSRSMAVCWQPMIQGVLYLGRRAGMVKDITAEIVFAGEPFRFLRGDEPKIVHEWVPDIREKAYHALRPIVAPKPQRDPNEPPLDDAEQSGPDYMAFWDMIVAAYCIITGPDGSRTRRAMTRSRLLLLQDFAKAKAGPWRSVWLDEMIIKSAVHHAMKHVDTAPKDEEDARRFREALDQDMDADLADLDDDAIEAAPTLPSLSAPNPADKLSTLEAMGLRQKEKVAVNGGSGNDHLSEQRDAGQSSTEEETFADRAARFLTAEKNRGKWLDLLIAIYADADTLDEIASIRAIESVKRNSANMPELLRARMEEAEKEAIMRARAASETNNKEPGPEGAATSVAQGVAAVLKAEKAVEEDDGWPGPR